MTFKLQPTIKRHPWLPQIQMVVQKAPEDHHIPFLRIMVLFVASELLGIHNKCMVLNTNWMFHALGVLLVPMYYLITVNWNHVLTTYQIMVSHIQKLTLIHLLFLRV